MMCRRWLGTKQSITIQWERLPRRERERLDRQQHLISSRFRVTEQVRQDSSFSLSVVPSPGVYSSVGPSREAESIIDGGSNSHHPSTNPTMSNHNNNNGVILPPSDAAISSSIDRPQSGGNAAGAGTEAAAADNRGLSSSGLWAEGDVRVEAGSRGVAARKGTPRYPVARAGRALHTMATPWGERRRRGAGGMGKRGGSGVACGVPDADIASGLARRGRLGDSSLGVVGIRTSITSEDQ